ncbi:MAG: hypothetical protein KatS3mg056_0406 [Chloroflexus sp.]|jgi:hypothetical protein|nr:MAG: hypothetical protein KatS3mg056_0406 [Chloroflexus sp.]
MKEGAMHVTMHRTFLALFNQPPPLSVVLPVL